MTLLNAPEFDEKKESRNRNLLIGAAVFIALAVVVTLVGFVLGHGWAFMNLPAEFRVKSLLATAQSGDYAKAYGIFYNDPQWQQHPEKYQDYPLKRFTEDFSTESTWSGPIKSFHIDCSKRDDTGVAVSATVNGGTNLTLKYQRKDHTLSFFPYQLTCGF
jgi:hypothetical protein